jgi:NhaA family Na+:H+ antiporter
MIVPALMYRYMNANPALVKGWGIPMATDIAFCVAVLVVLGRRVPQSLMIFLVTLAIVDDLGAVLVIALFYTSQIMLWPLAAAAGFFLVLILLNMGGVRSLAPYLFIGVGMWFTLLSSGIHATVAGILVAFCIPARPSYHPETFSLNVRKLMDHFDSLTDTGKTVWDDSDRFAVLQSLRNGLRKAESPLRRIEVVLHLPVAMVVIPLFAITNAGVHFSYGFLSLVTAHPVAHGVFLGLVAGKFIGIAGFSWAAVRLRLAVLPAGLSLAHVGGVGFLGGIGFTMSIFIAELCFASFPERVVVAKTAIILASVTAGALGIIWLLLVDRWWGDGRMRKGQEQGAR